MKPDPGILMQPRAVDPIKRVSWIAAAALLLVSGCSLGRDTGGPEGPRVDREHLAQQWVRSFEEEPEESDVQTYRPDGFIDFAPARFRMRYIFNSDGSCQWYFLAPDDGHHFRPCAWSYRPQEHLLVVHQDEDPMSYRIVELTETVLRMAPVNNGK